jgi:quercetin dioxygenase-like cupin family protein
VVLFFQPLPARQSCSPNGYPFPDQPSAPFDAVVKVLDGETELTIGCESINGTSGQMIVMPANVSHAVMARQRFKMLLTMLRA